MRILIGIILLFSIFSNAFPQKQGSELIDSLKSDLTRSAEDTNKVILLGKLSFEYHRFNTDLGIYYGEQAILLSQKLKYGTGVAASYNFLATNYAIKGNYPKALDYFMKSLSKFTETGDQAMIATLENNLGLIYVNINEPAKAIECFDKALVINERLNNIKGQSLNYGNLGIIYSNQNQFVKANEYYYKALKIDEKINNKDAVARNLSNIASSELAMGDYCEALNIGYKALKISKEISSVYNEANCSMVIGETYFTLSGDTIKFSSLCNYFTADKKTNLINANKYLGFALKLYKQLNNLRSVSETSLTLSEIYEKLGDYKKALEFHKNYSANYDSVYSKDNSFIIANLEKMSELSMRDNQIKIKTLEIENKNSQMLLQIIVSITILVAVSLLSFFFYNKHKYQKKINIELDHKNKELKRLYATQNKFFSIIAHDLKSPFQGFLGLSQIMVEEAGNYSPEELTKFGGDLYQSANNLLRLLKNLFDWAQMQKGSIILQPKELSLTKLIAENVETINRRCEQKGIKIINNVTTPLQVNADENMLNSVLLNLISNAVKFTKKDGTVTVSVKKCENEMTEISVSDNGVGMPKSTVDKLFVLGEKIGTRGTDGELSTGLGLLLCKEFVEKNGGQIRVESKEGKGSTFYFTIPGCPYSFPHPA
jgi:signal transduction histidine kinase